ncbi:MAG TPA: phosphate ABC transporter substrate-binding protein PstS [Gemmatimonadaceae bacterium]|nr:phosphate ABC transporter substrate-binding protein PstS [Gemmatimonadaceae bacterium]
MRNAFVRVAVAGALLGASACGSEASRSAGDTTRTAAPAGGVDLTGAGATFPYPLYSKWFSEYAAKTGVKINYQSIGSGGGIRQLSEQTVDFGASDAPMTDDELAKARGGEVLHVPTVIGAVAIAYNLPTVKQPLRLSGPVAADIFLGKLTRWSDTRIAVLNPGVTLPNSDILIAHRSDGSGTTFIFTSYLSAVSGDWKSGPGAGKQIQWPAGIGGKGNEGVAGTIKQTPGAVGYVELAYAQQNNLPTTLVQNADGQFVAPSIEGATAAAQGAVSKLPANTDYRVSIVNATGAASYPIASFTWLLVYRHMADPAKAKKLAEFVRWALTDGQKDASDLAYAPLPSSMAKALVARVDSISSGSTR